MLRFYVSILGFYIDSGATDNVVGWTQLSATERASIKAEYAAAGISLMISAFGSTEQPTTSKLFSFTAPIFLNTRADGVDPVAFANTLADFVIQYGLDGIDIDYEVCLLAPFFDPLIYSFLRISLLGISKMVGYVILALTGQTN